jgi:hypothetical protein
VSFKRVPCRRGLHSSNNQLKSEHFMKNVLGGFSDGNGSG